MRGRYKSCRTRPVGNKASVQLIADEADKAIAKSLDQSQHAALSFDLNAAIACAFSPSRPVAFLAVLLFANHRSIRGSRPTAISGYASGHIVRLGPFYCYRTRYLRMLSLDSVGVWNVSSGGDGPHLSATPFCPARLCRNLRQFRFIVLLLAFPHGEDHRRKLARHRQSGHLRTYLLCKHRRVVLLQRLSTDRIQRRALEDLLEPPIVVVIQAAGLRRFLLLEQFSRDKLLVAARACHHRQPTIRP